MPIVLAVAVSYHKLVPHVGTTGMQCEYHTNFLKNNINIFCFSPVMHQTIPPRMQKLNNIIIGLGFCNNRINQGQVECYQPQP